MTLHMRYTFWLISELPSSKQRREMTKFVVLWNVALPIRFCMSQNKHEIGRVT